MLGMDAVKIAKMIIVSDTRVHSIMYGWRGCHTNCMYDIV